VEITHVKDIFDDDDAMDRLAGKAIRDAMRRHKERGESIVTMRDGEIVWIPPEEIVIPEEE
jgi:hypothetical protein